MKRIALTILTIIAIASSTIAQTKKIFRIDYKSQYPDEAVDAADDASSIVIQAWTNTDFFRVNLTDDYPGIYIADKKNNTAYILLPTSEEYINISEEDSASDLQIEYVAGSKKVIHGYTCKLAKIDAGATEEGEEPTIIEIWYTEQIPYIYWSQFSFLKNIPGAALSITVAGTGISASQIVQEPFKKADFEVPSNYTESAMAEEYEEENNEVAENLYTFTDEEGTLVGLKDEEDNIILEPTYREILPFVGEFSVAVDADQKYGVIDKSGKITIPFKFDYLSFDEESNQYMYGENDKYGILNSDGTVFLKANYEMLNYFKDGYAIFSQGDKYGIVNAQGKVVIPATHSYITGTNKTSFIIANNDIYQLYSIAQNKQVGQNYAYLTTTDEPTLILAMKDGKFGFIDNSGKTVIPFKFTYASPFEDGYSSVTEDENTEDIYFIDPKGERIAVPQIQQ